MGTYPVVLTLCYLRENYLNSAFSADLDCVVLLSQELLNVLCFCTSADCDTRVSGFKLVGGGDITVMLFSGCDLEVLVYQPCVTFRHDMMKMMHLSSVGLKSPEEPLEYLPPTDALPNDPRVVNRQRNSDYQFPCSPFSDTQKETAEDGHYSGHVERLEDQYELTDDPFTTKHSISAVIETTLLEEYKLFARKIQEILQQKNIAYISGMSTPVLSAQERMMRLSEHICLQASEVSVQEYIESLSEKLNSVILASCMKQTAPIYSSPEGLEVVSSTAPRPVPDTLAVCRDSDTAPLPEPLCNNLGEELQSPEQPSASLPLGKEKMDHGNAKPEGQTSGGDLMEPPEKTQKSPENVNISTQPAFSDFISQLKPEVFNSLVKIMKDVQKNTVKFYIHEEEESVLCREIKVKLFSVQPLSSVRTSVFQIHFYETGLSFTVKVNCESRLSYPISSLSF